MYKAKNNKNKIKTGTLLRRAVNFNTIMIGEAAIVGLVAGAVTLAYRILLEYADVWLHKIIEWTYGNPGNTLVWFAALVIMAFVVGALVKMEPMISGSGIPQVEGEVFGGIRQRWRRILPAKFFGGFLCQLGGMALGREGPSIQLGAMAGKGISRTLRRPNTEGKFLMTAGASAGLATAFQAPLAGAMFAIEEIHKGFSVAMIISVMTASLTSGYLCSIVLGLKPVFQFETFAEIEPVYYWLIVLLGILLGLFGVIYNWFTLKVQSLFTKMHRSVTLRLILIFLICGVLSIVLPDVLGGGNRMVEQLCAGGYAFNMLVLLLVVRFIFSALSFGSGAPGGIFLPMLVLGAFVGGVFAELSSMIVGVDGTYFNNFVILAMAGTFTAIVRAPLTGIVLIFEMTGTANHFLSLALVSVIAYIVATLMNSKPIYESLLERIMDGTSQQSSKLIYDEEKVLYYFTVLHGGNIANKKISNIDWPKGSLIVAVKRGTEEIIPKGEVILRPADMVIVMCAESREPFVRTEIESMNLQGS